MWAYSKIIKYIDADQNIIYDIIHKIKETATEQMHGP